MKVKKRFTKTINGIATKNDHNEFKDVQQFQL